MDNRSEVATLTAEPGSPTAHALLLLASWAATPDQVPTTQETS